MNVELIVNIVSQLLKLGGIIFFMFAAYDGTFGGQGSTSVFIGTGVLVLVLAGSYVVDKIGRL
ncbi:MAG: hypothetical protein B7Y56_14040 [Gallionellales bacterium 35-53-114]|nr:MAG: hypothetical protein B7Y56_14040 [Gallionellales bacterium 35-53-114]OYZ62326.1 MAG: hypothetical protein B7Y04_14290 [Gallionellales bacterium 24-53-125]OZB07366.1 MAG: hypothetical protein B7X61_14710 [Gallionellales bacterium 39-52-133]HQS59539.1 hypothetical protein [Gallionellaceae bacterium]HQS75558.1 hypothetical protein [Gallionellaceae bacterium]